MEAGSAFRPINSMARFGLTVSAEEITLVPKLHPEATQAKRASSGVGAQQSSHPQHNVGALWFYKLEMHVPGQDVVSGQDGSAASESAAPGSATAYCICGRVCCTCFWWQTKLRKAPAV